jgi:replication-associated recombination protein RarA
MSTFSEARTRNGHACGEVASALQKSIRRGEEREALYWASELDLAGYGNYCFKRLRIIASETSALASRSCTSRSAACTRTGSSNARPTRGTA